jgi:two-component system capsular synthesis response regulator RcsB
MQDPVRVVVADDHPVILFGAEQALLKFPGLQVVARARQSTELIKVLQTIACDVLVTDLAMPGGQYGDGLPLIGYLRRNFPNLPIVVLTMLENAALCGHRLVLSTFRRFFVSTRHPSPCIPLFSEV